MIQTDEKSVLVNRDGHSAGSKSYMWVYLLGHFYTDKQIVLYNYHKTRNSSQPREFLIDYSGICVKVSVPILGSGITRIGDVTPTRQELLDLELL